MSETPPCRRALLAGLVACALACAGLARVAAVEWPRPGDGAPGDDRERSQRTARLVEERAALLAASAFLGREARRFEDESTRGKPNFLRDLREAAGGTDEGGLVALDGLVRELADRLGEAARAQREGAGPLRERFVELRAGLIGRRGLVAAAHAGGSARPGGRARPWAAAALAPLAFLAVAAYDRRQELRRALHRAGGPRWAIWLPLMALALAAVSAACTSRGDPDGGAQPDGPGLGTGVDLGADALGREVRTLRAKVAEGERRYEQTFARWRESLGAEIGPVGPLADDWLKARNALRELEVALALRTALAEAIRTDRDELNRCDAELTALAEAGRRLPEGAAWRLARELALPLASFAGLAALALADRMRSRADGETCARCLAAGGLRPEAAHAPGGGPPPSFVRCEADWGDGGECGYVFPDAIRYRRRLCFPTVGVTQAGKTHWMAALSGELPRSGGKPARFEPIETRGSVHLRQVLEQIRAKVKIQRSFHHVLPDPVLYDFVDADLPLRSEALLHLFDYAGEVAQSLDARHPLRRRMLQADGYFAFLDPTNDPELQREIFDGVYRDFWGAGRVSHGRAAGVPAAVCLTKVDELYERLDPARHGAVIDTFYQGLRAVEALHGGGQVTLGLIEGRSRVVRRFVRELWPRVDIEDRFRRLFGSRFQFFPMTPYGLEHLGGGEPAGSSGEPFAVQEPLLWMLHANGYVVFRRPVPWPARLGRGNDDELA